MAKVLSTGNPKLMKGEKQGYLSFILHLAPSWLSGHNACPMASAGCIKACLNTAGRGGMFKLGETTNNIQQARIRKTLWFFENRDSFMMQLVRDIAAGIRKAEREGKTPVFRLNGTSDLRWETIPVKGTYSYRRKTVTVDAENIMALFPNVQFYDYTKIPNRRNLPANYHLTFSRSEDNEHLIPADMNVAVVFNKLPETYLGRTVVNGDETDLRFLDPQGVVVGLKAKGKAKQDSSGFVVTVE
jgi:hypothetical protein